MSQLASIEVESQYGPVCTNCAVTMRLLGVENHPIIKRAKLRTYLCPRCDGVETEIVPNFAEPNSRAVLAGGAFDAEMTGLLGSTFDTAWEVVLASDSLRDNQQHTASVRELLARCIVERMQRGETNPSRIAENVLRSVLEN